MPGQIPVSTGTMTRRIVMSAAHDGPVFHGARKPGQMFATRIPGTVVGISLNVPRMFEGALGFKSNVSR